MNNDRTTCQQHCEQGEYESQAATEPHPQICSELTVCSDSQYETDAPTDTSDRQCASITTCSGNQYLHGDAAYYSTWQCLTVCPSGQYESVAPSITNGNIISDRACADITTSCPEGERLGSVTSSTNWFTGSTGIIGSYPNMVINNRQCLENVCACQFGSGARGTACPSNGANKCASCNDNYELISDECVLECDDGFVRGESGDCEPLCNCGAFGYCCDECGEFGYCCDCGEFGQCDIY